MFSMIKSLFSSPEHLLGVMSRRDMQEEKEEGERILIDEDGSASVNIESPEVHEDFARHVSTLRFAGNPAFRQDRGKAKLLKKISLRNTLPKKTNVQRYTPSSTTALTDQCCNAFISEAPGSMDV